MPDVPKIIHLMYFPWDKSQRLIPDQLAFDHRPYENMVRYAPDFEVKLWDFPATEALCLRHYPEIWNLALSLPRPMMLVNTLRWLMVYHFGGISWQYDMNPLVPMERILPSPGKACRVFTEFELTPEQCLVKAPEPIRNGEPEESVRIPSQAFAAVPRHRYIKAVVDFIHQRSKSFTFKRDYDCQFITGNAAASTAYDLFGKDDPAVERVGLIETRRMMKLVYQGTWRTEVGSVKSGGAIRKAEVGGRMRGLVKAASGLRPLIHRFVKPHVHETAFADLRRETPGMVSASDELLKAVAGLIDGKGGGRVLNYPCAHLPGLERHVPVGVQVVGGDMVRGGGSARFMNLLFSRVPRADVVVMRNFLDHIGNADILAVFDRIRRAGVRYVLTTHYPCLNLNWDTYAGEWRPVNLALAPFSFPEPERVIPDPDPERRPDRVLGLWDLRAVGVVR